MCKQCRIDSLVQKVKEKYGVETAPLPEEEEDSSRYTIRSADGLVLGPIKMRTVKVLAREKRIKGREEVSKDNSEFKPLMNYPELQDLFPELKEVMDTSGLEDKLDEAFSAAFGGEQEPAQVTAGDDGASAAYEPSSLAPEGTAPQSEETAYQAEEQEQKEARTTPMQPPGLPPEGQEAGNGEWPPAEETVPYGQAPKEALETAEEEQGPSPEVAPAPGEDEAAPPTEDTPETAAADLDETVPEEEEAPAEEAAPTEAEDTVKHDVPEAEVEFTSHSAEYGDEASPGHEAGEEVTGEPVPPQEVEAGAAEVEDEVPSEQEPEDYIASWQSPAREREPVENEEADDILSGEDLAGIGKEASPAVEDHVEAEEKAHLETSPEEESGEQAALAAKPVSSEKVGTEFDLSDEGEEETEEIIEALEPYSEPTADTRYQVRYPDGMILGPVKLATIKELFETGNLTGEEEVQREEETWKSFTEMPELMDLMSEEEEEEAEDVVELTDVLEES